MHAWGLLLQMWQVVRIDQCTLLLPLPTPPAHHTTLFAVVACLLARYALPAAALALPPLPHSRSIAHGTEIDYSELCFTRYSSSRPHMIVVGYTYIPFFVA